MIAYSTFNQTPPPRARFGRYEPAAGEPTGLEVLCTNPAELSGDRGALETLTRTEDFPGTIGLTLQLLFAGMPPDADTPWVQPQDHFTGRCVREAGANVLRIDAVGSARQLVPSPDPTWGLHLVDVNIAMGNLVTIVGGQSAAYLERACLRRAGLAGLGTNRAADRRRLTGRRPSGRAGIDRYCVAGEAACGSATRLAARPQVCAARSSCCRTAGGCRWRACGRATRVRNLRRRLGGERRFRVGRTVWFVARARRAALVFRVRGDRVAAVGLGRLSLNRTAADTRKFLRTWQRG